MPYNLVPVKIANGAVLPKSLCTWFVEAYQYPVLSTAYNDGAFERSLIADGVNQPRYLRTFVLAKRLTTAELNALYQFWTNTVQGGLYPFYFYNPFDLGSVYDPTGTRINGRVPVFFRGDWAQTSNLARHSVSSLALVETADLVEGLERVIKLRSSAHG